MKRLRSHSCSFLWKILWIIATLLLSLAMGELKTNSATDDYDAITSTEQVHMLSTLHDTLSSKSHHPFTAENHNPNHVTLLASGKPTLRPSFTPSRGPTRTPTTLKPTNTPSPSRIPTAIPSVEPTTATPTTQKPTAIPTTTKPTAPPSFQPSALPSFVPSFKPTREPTSPFPSVTPTTAMPSISQRPTRFPIAITSKRPSISPTLISAHPTTRSPTMATAPPTEPWIPVKLEFQSSITLANVKDSVLDKTSRRVIQQAYIQALKLNSTDAVCEVQETIMIESTSSSSSSKSTSLSSLFENYLTNSVRALTSMSKRIQSVFGLISPEGTASTATTYDAVIWVQVTYGISDSLQAKDIFTSFRNRLMKSFNDGSFETLVIKFAIEHKAIGLQEITLTGFQTPIDFVAKYYEQTKESRLPPTSVSGIVVGVLFGVILIVFMMLYRWRQHRIVKVGPVVDGLGAKYQLQDGKLIFTPLKTKPSPDKLIINTPPGGSIVNEGSFAGSFYGGSIGGGGGGSLTGSQVLIDGGSFNELFTVGGIGGIDGHGGMINDQFPGIVDPEPGMPQESYLSFNG